MLALSSPPLYAAQGMVLPSVAVSESRFNEPNQDNLPQAHLEAQVIPDLTGLTTETNTTPDLYVPSSCSPYDVP